ncbi:unnamed protein product [Lactuca virosa]|uniref:Uncharacterized protein n=1 Tax=Lactuca virosa TaxID=75947 RepID=A0AAU9NEZ5_9ASTR|nr:unnamed protein product [Lactuca virosa]
MEGLNPISDDVEYAAFIFDAYGTNGIISVYVDHIGVGVDGWFDDEDNDDDACESCIDGENEDNIDELRNVEFEINEDVVHMNRTSNDPFLKIRDKVNLLRKIQRHYQVLPSGLNQFEGVVGEEAVEAEEGIVGEEVVGANVQVQQGRVRPILEILKRIRRRKSKRILKLKLGKTIGGVDDPGNSKGKALLID